MKSSEFANAIYSLYPPFRQWDDVTLKAWTDTVVSECGDSVFSAEIRAQAFKTLTRVRHREKPPQTATIFEHCREVKRWQEAEKGNGELSAGAAPVGSGPLDWNEDAFKFSRDVMSGPMGLQAAKEGWIGCLDEYIRKNRRAPSAGEIPALKRKAAEFDETYAMCIRGGIHDVARWVGLGEDVLARRNRLIDWRLGLR
jgi:hypothetical protein